MLLYIHISFAELGFQELKIVPHRSVFVFIIESLTKEKFDFVL